MKEEIFTSKTFTYSWKDIRQLIINDLRVNQRIRSDEKSKLKTEVKTLMGNKVDVKKIDGIHVKLSIKEENENEKDIAEGGNET